MAARVLILLSFLAYSKESLSMSVKGEPEPFLASAGTPLAQPAAPMLQSLDGKAGFASVVMSGPPKVAEEAPCHLNQVSIPTLAVPSTGIQHRDNLGQPDRSLTSPVEDKAKKTGESDTLPTPNAGTGQPTAASSQHIPSAESTSEFVEKSLSLDDAACQKELGNTMAFLNRVIRSHAEVGELESTAARDDEYLLKGRSFKDIVSETSFASFLEVESLTSSDHSQLTDTYEAILEALANGGPTSNPSLQQQPLETHLSSQSSNPLSGLRQTQGVVIGSEKLPSGAARDQSIENALRSYIHSNMDKIKNIVREEERGELKREIDGSSVTHATPRCQQKLQSVRHFVVDVMNEHVKTMEERYRHMIDSERKLESDIQSFMKSGK